VNKPHSVEIQELYSYLSCFLPKILKDVGGIQKVEQTDKIIASIAVFVIFTAYSRKHVAEKIRVSI
jgi:hypothetical protein